MAELQIDDDWKKQAQEEKRKLAEAEAAKKAAATTASPAPSTAPGAAPLQGRARRGNGQAEVPVASFGTLVQTVMTQALFYLGELGSRTGQTSVDLDMARLQLDLMGTLEEKTKGNLTEEEQKMLDSALYEIRMRFVSVAREYVELGGRS